jgi:formate hydrogenlyase transcriptional activator
MPGGAPVFMTDGTTAANLQDQASPTKPPASAQSLSSEAALETLRMILLGASLTEVLTSVTRLIGAHSQGMSWSICVLDEDGSHLRYVAAHLPEAYRKATDGMCIGPDAGSCGAAAYLGEPVFVSDMVSHPNWATFTDAVLQSGLRAAWSTPIMSHDGQVQGTFCLYDSEVRDPGPQELQLIDHASRVVGIAMERNRTQSALTLAFETIVMNEQSLRLIVDSIPAMVTTLNAAGEVELVNRQALEQTGKTTEELKNWATSDLVHPDDLTRMIDAWRHANETGQGPDHEMRSRGADGVYRWVHVRARPQRDAEGRIVRWYNLVTDIDERKRAEDELGRAFEEIKRLKDHLHDENVVLREQIDQVFMFEEIVGSAPALKTVLSSITRVAPTDSTVLITGETGTGKELIARAIHKSSQRAGRPFVGVNCAAIPSSLIASELFGHEKGAFTGALQLRQGRFELAHSGTMFLDEIGELPAETQIALLRVLQERQFERVGGNRVIRVDVRVIAATNLDLTTAIASGAFRADLFYRLNVFPIAVPPLRDRKEDIPMLVEYFVKRYAEKARKTIRKIDKNTFTLCQSYDWPGNIRELQNIIERSVILSTGDTFWIDERWLSSSNARHPASSGPLTENLRSYEKQLIESALARSNGKVAGPDGAAAKLGVPRSTLDARIKQLKITRYTVR